jgi:hypothetical protein
MGIIRLKENDRAMRYKSYEINASENEPGKWLASIRRADGSPITCRGTTLPFFTTAETTTEQYAIDLAKGAIDGGFFN